MKRRAPAVATPQALPYGRPCIEEDDIAAVAAVLRSGWLTTGPMVERFEAKLAEAVGAPHAVVCNSGTAALHLAVMALDLGPSSTVIIPAITFVATANAARYVGARVLFADVDPMTGLMTPATLEAALTRAGGAQAVIPVHLNGQTCALPAIFELAQHHDLVVIEDACHALGARYDGPARGGYPVGACAHSDAACFSFHPVKTIAMGEGGAVTTTYGARAERMRRLRGHGIERMPGRFTEAAQAYAAEGHANPWYYELQELGFNYRASDVQCALGLSQLGKLARFAEARAALVAAYDQALAPYAPDVMPLGKVPGCTPTWHLYVVHINFTKRGLSRADVMGRLHKAGVGSQVHYLPVPFQPFYRNDEAGDPQALYPGATAYYAGCLSLPLFVGMTTQDVDRVISALAAALEL